LGGFDVWSSATTQSRLLRSGEISASELVEIYRERIERFNPALNAIVVNALDQARARAREIDDLPPGSRPLPLAGLPMTVKESLEVAGLPTTGGLSDARGRISSYDSPHVRALFKAGMTLMGKTNIPTECADWQANSPVYGRTNNPWDLNRTPGGSSGGSAAAVAAGLTPLDIGTDIGGSIRVPASYCGVYGLRPSETAVPRFGDFPGNPHPNSAYAMSVSGPIARHAEDLELALDIISGPVPGEDVGWRLEIPPARHDQLADFRVGLLGDISWVSIGDDVHSALANVRVALESVGAHVVPIDPEQLFAGSRRHHLDYIRLLFSIMGQRLDDAGRATIDEALADETDLVEAINDAFTQRPSAMFHWFDRREEQRSRFREIYRYIDVLLAPITLSPAFEHMTEQRILVDLFTRQLLVDEKACPYRDNLVHPALATFAGQPAVAFPVGLSRSGLPVGLQAIGPYIEDRTPIRFAQLLANEIGGFTPPPGYTS
jgi:amidase